MFLRRWDRWIFLTSISIILRMLPKITSLIFLFFLVFIFSVTGVKAASAGSACCAYHDCDGTCDGFTNCTYMCSGAGKDCSVTPPNNPGKCTNTLNVTCQQWNDWTTCDSNHCQERDCKNKPPNDLQVRSCGGGICGEATACDSGQITCGSQICNGPAEECSNNGCVACGSGGGGTSPTNDRCHAVWPVSGISIYRPRCALSYKIRTYLYSSKTDCSKKTYYDIKDGNGNFLTVAPNKYVSTKSCLPSGDNHWYTDCGYENSVAHGSWLNFAVYPNNPSGMCNAGLSGTTPQGVDYYDTKIVEGGKITDSNCTSFYCSQDSDGFYIRKNGTITGTLFNFQGAGCSSVSAAPLSGITVHAQSAADAAHGLVWPDTNVNQIYSATTGVDGKYSIPVPIDNYNLTFTLAATGQVLTPTSSCASATPAILDPKAFFYGEANDQTEATASIVKNFGFDMSGCVVDCLPISGSGWWQGKDTDIMTSGGITSALPKATSNLILPGAGGYPGVAIYGGTATLNLGSNGGQLSSKNWKAQTAISLGDYSFTKFLDKIPSTVTFNACPTNLDTLVSGTPTLSNGYAWYKCTADSVFTSSTGIVNILSKKIVIMVNGGSVNIKSKINLTKGTGFFGLFTSGNINVDPTVGNPGGGSPSLEGIYFADGVISTGINNTGGPGTDTPPANCPLNDPCADPKLLWKFDDAAGATVTDSIDSSHNGTWHGSGNHWASGRYAGGGIFNGVNDYVDIPNYTLSGAFTISYWYYAFDTTHGGTAIGMYHSDWSGDGAKIAHDASGNHFKIRIKDGGTVDTSVPLPSAGAWHMVTLTRDTSNKVNLYVDAGVANSLFTQSGDVVIYAIGKNWDCCSGWFTGKLDQVKVYKYARTPVEIANDFGTVFSNQLYVRGSLAGMGGINLQRVLTDNTTTPAELFEYAPDQALLLPSVFGSKQTWWQEVAP